MSKFVVFCLFLKGGSLFSDGDNLSVEGLVSWLLEHPSTCADDSDTDPVSSEEDYSDTDSFSEGSEDYENLRVCLASNPLETFWKLYKDRMTMLFPTNLAYSRSFLFLFSY